MSDETPRRILQDVDWRIPIYVLAGVTLLLLIGSFTGTGHGLYGSGFMMAWMWVWVLVIIAALVLFGYFLGRDRSDAAPRQD